MQFQCSYYLKSFMFLGNYILPRVQGLRKAIVSYTFNKCKQAYLKIREDEKGIVAKYNITVLVTNEI